MILNSQALAVELEVARIISEQGRHGVAFNKERAQFLIHLLDEMIVHTDILAVPQLPKLMVTEGEYLKPFKKNGQLQQYVLEYIKKTGDMGMTQHICGPFSKVYFTPFDMGKTGLIKDYLLTQGWEPDTWNWKDAEPDILETYMDSLLSSPSLNQRLSALNFSGSRNKGNLRQCLNKERKWPTSPKFSESSFDTVQGTVPALVKDRVVWSHRRSLLVGLLEKLRPDGKLSAEANPLATPTGRMRHRIVVNIPAAGKAKFGAECRGLFIGDYDRSIERTTLLTPPVPQGARVIAFTNRYEVDKKGKWVKSGYVKMLVPKGRQVFVGYDGAGLELRMLAHYINNLEYTKEVLSGDPHADNLVLLQEHWKKPNPAIRDDAKTFLYAFMYGAGDKKLGTIVGGTSHDGAKLRESFLKRNPGLSAIVDRIRTEANKGYLTGIDGRRLVLRRGSDGKPMTHKGLNLLLQGAGAIVMKYAMVMLDQAVRAKGLRAHKVIDMHDEGQWSCHPDDAVVLAELMGQCVKSAGEYLKMNIPLASDAKIGASWYHTH